MSSAAKKTLNSKQWELLTQCFEEAAALDAAERAHYLRRWEEKNPLIGLELRKLLKSDSVLKNFLEVSPTTRLSSVLDEALSPDSLSPGSRIGDFLIAEVLGRGSFATVYLATEMALAREVALKVSVGVSEEAKTIASLDHRSIVQVYSEQIEPSQKLRLICMQYIRGASLEVILGNVKGALTGSALLKTLQELNSPPLTFNAEEISLRSALAECDQIDVILKLGIQMCEALSYAHSRNVLHLDVKPANILINHCGVPLLTDFNISIRANAERGEIPEHFGGTPTYMSPEQREVFEVEDESEAFAKIDARSDIYSLGVVLSELFTEVRPRGPLFQSEVNLRLNLKTATETNSRDRFATANDFFRALQTCLELRSIERRLGERRKIARFSEHHPLIALTLIGALPQVLAAVIGVAYNSIEIVDQLGGAQKVWFQKLNATYLPVSYLAVSLIWFLVVFRVYPFLKAPEKWTRHPEDLRKMKQHVLNIPYWGMCCCALGWLPGALLYPAVLQLRAEHMQAVVVWHFIASFTLSWLIALSYSFVFHQYIALRDLYPRLMVGSLEEASIRKGLVKRMSQLTRASLALCILSPLGGALLVLAAGPGDLAHTTDFRCLVGVLILLGIAGVIFSASIGPKLVRCLSCFL